MDEGCPRQCKRSEDDDDDSDLRVCGEDEQERVPSMCKTETCAKTIASFTEDTVKQTANRMANACKTAYGQAVVDELSLPGFVRYHLSLIADQCEIKLQESLPSGDKNTCFGAVNGLISRFDSACPRRCGDGAILPAGQQACSDGTGPMRGEDTCGYDTGCDEFMRGLDNDSLILYTAGLKDCRTVPDMQWAAGFDQGGTAALAHMVTRIATQCGVPDSLNVDHPVVDMAKCEVKIFKFWEQADQACPKKCTRDRNNQNLPACAEGEAERSESSCGTSTCKMFLDSITDDWLHKYNEAVSECGEVDNGQEGGSDDSIRWIAQAGGNFPMLLASQIADECSLKPPAGFSFPVENTCYGAILGMVRKIDSACPRQCEIVRGPNDDPDIVNCDGQSDRSPDSCGPESACDEFVSSLSDNSIEAFVAGLQTCPRNSPVTGYRDFAAGSADRAKQLMIEIATACGVQDSLSGDWDGAGTSSDNGCAAGISRFWKTIDDACPKVCETDGLWSTHSFDVQYPACAEGQQERTAETCRNRRCNQFLSSMTDDRLGDMVQQMVLCENEDVRELARRGPDFFKVILYEVADQCEVHPPAKVSKPDPESCWGSVFSFLEKIYKACPRQCEEIDNPEHDDATFRNCEPGEAERSPDSCGVQTECDKFFVEIDVDDWLTTARAGFADCAQIPGMDDMVAISEMSPDEMKEVLYGIANSCGVADFFGKGGGASKGMVLGKRWVTEDAMPFRECADACAPGRPVCINTEEENVGAQKSAVAQVPSGLAWIGHIDGSSKYYDGFSCPSGNDDRTKCLENGKPDDDCCALEDTIGCADGWVVKQLDEVCWRGELAGREYVAYKYACYSTHDIFQNFAPGQPSGENKCTALQVRSSYTSSIEAGKWDDVECETELKCICEWNKGDETEKKDSGSDDDYCSELLKRFIGEFNVDYPPNYGLNGPRCAPDCTKNKKEISKVLPLCENGNSVFGEACQANDDAKKDCRARLRGLNQGALRAIRSSCNRNQRVMQLVNDQLQTAQTAASSCVPSFGLPGWMNGSGGGSGGGDKVRACYGRYRNLGISQQCPRDCDSDDLPEPAQDLVPCRRGQNERGIKCKVGNAPNICAARLFDIDADDVWETVKFCYEVPQMKEWNDYIFATLRMAAKQCVDDEDDRYVFFACYVGMLF